MQLEHNCSKVDIKPPRRQQQDQRNTALRGFLKNVHESGRVGAKDAEIEWLSNPRKIKVGHEIIYEQARDGIGGVWMGSFSNWQ